MKIDGDVVYGENAAFAGEKADRERWYAEIMTARVARGFRAGDPEPGKPGLVLITSKDVTVEDFGGGVRLSGGTPDEHALAALKISLFRGWKTPIMTGDGVFVDQAASLLEGIGVGPDRRPGDMPFAARWWHRGSWQTAKYEERREMLQRLKEEVADILRQLSPQP